MQVGEADRRTQSPRTDNIDGRDHGGDRSSQHRVPFVEEYESVREIEAGGLYVSPDTQSKLKGLCQSELEMSPS